MDLDQAAAEYEAATLYFLDCAAQVTNDTIDRRPPDGWSARQVIHHVADSEAQSYARLRRLLAEPEGSVIQGYDEAAWAQASLLGYTELPVEHSLAVFTAVRASSLDLIRRLEPRDLDRCGIHTESGRYSVDTWLRTYVGHPCEHGDQLLSALRTQPETDS